MKPGDRGSRQKSGGTSTGRFAIGQVKQCWRRHKLCGVVQSCVQVVVSARPAGGMDTAASAQHLHANQQGLTSHLHSGQVNCARCCVAGGRELRPQTWSHHRPSNS